MNWIWVGRNSVGEDWSLGRARLFTLTDAIKVYARCVRAACNHGAPLRGWLARRSA
jgi:hypothetical protein